MKIKSIKTYRSAFDVLSENFDIEPGKNGLTQDDIDSLDGFDSFDSIIYYVINDETVVSADAVSGDKYDECSLGEFLASALRYIREEE